MLQESVLYGITLYRIRLYGNYFRAVHFVVAQTEFLFYVKIVRRFHSLFEWCINIWDSHISKNGGIILNNTQKQNLRKSLWSKGKLNRNLIGKSAKEILTLSNLKVKTNINSSEFIVVNENIFDYL